MTPPLIKRFLIAFKEHKLLSLLVFILVVGASIVLGIQPQSERQKNYKVVGRLSFSNPPPVSTTNGQQGQVNPRMLLNQDLLISSRLLVGVAERVNLDPEEIKAIIKDIEIVFPEDSLNDSPIQSEVISLEYKVDTKQEQAQLILTALMEEMVEYSHWLNGYQLRERIEALTKRLEVVQTDLAEAEQSFYRYITQEGSSLLSVQDGSLSDSITENQRQQRVIQIQLQEVNGQIESIVEQLGLTPSQAYRATILSADPMITELRTKILENEARIEQLEQELRREHPTMLKLFEEQQANEKLLQQRAKELIGEDGANSLSVEEIRQQGNLDLLRQELANRLLALETQQQGLTQQLTSLEEIEQKLLQEYAQYPDKQLIQARLAQEVENQRVLYETIMEALTDAQGAEVETVSSLLIAQEPALVETTATLALPNDPLLIVGGGVVVGAIGVSSLILLLSSFDDRLHTAQELRETLESSNLRLLGQIPVITRGTKIPLKPVKIAKSGDIPFYERVRNKISRYGTESLKIILITSINPSEGKSTTAYNLAIASAQAGKRTLLLEANLSYKSAIEDECIELLPGQENLYFLPGVTWDQQTVNLMESTQLLKILRKVSDRFDTVIIDTPCLSSHHDPFWLEPLVDAVILVTRPGMTQKSLLKETIKEYREGELPLLGAVINHVEGLNHWSNEDYLPDLTSQWTIKELN